MHHGYNHHGYKHHDACIMDACIMDTCIIDGGLLVLAKVTGVNWLSCGSKTRRFWRRGMRRNRRGHCEAGGGQKEDEFLALISSGQISWAMQRVTSPVWHAWMIQPSGNGWSRSFQPGGTFCLKVSPSIVQLIMWEVWETPGSAPGCGGMRPEHLQVVGHKPEEEDVRMWSS